MDVSQLMKQFGDWAEKSASVFLMVFGAATFAIFGFDNPENLSGTVLAFAIAGSALMVISGGVLRVWAIKISSEATVKVKLAGLDKVENIVKSDPIPPSVPPGG